MSNRVLYGSVERVSAGARTGRVGVVDREALLLDRVLEVDARTVEIRDAHLVDDDLDAVEVDGRVSVEHALVEVQLVDQSRASTGLDGDAQTQVVAALLLEQAPDLGRRGVGQADSVGLGRGQRCVGHGSPYEDVSDFETKSGSIVRLSDENSLSVHRARSAAQAAALRRGPRA